MNAIDLDLMNPDGSVTVLEVSPTSTPPWALTVNGGAFRERRFEGDDLFSALIALRRELEPSGGRLLCAGSRRDVYPSGMSRSMGSARQAYLIKLGEPATVLVDIFDRADARDVGTIDEQSAYKTRWATSLREKLGK